MKKDWTENNFLVLLAAFIIYAIIVAIILFGFPMDKQQQQYYLQHEIKELSRKGFKVNNESPVHVYAAGFTTAILTLHTSKQYYITKEGGIMK